MLTNETDMKENLGMTDLKDLNDLSDRSEMTAMTVAITEGHENNMKGRITPLIQIQILESFI